MTTIVTLLGTVLIVVALRDIFQQLFHPVGGGSLSKSLMRIVWGLFRRVAIRRPALLSLAGPSILLTIVASWVALLAVGWALIYWPRLPEGFLLQTGLDPLRQGGFLDAFYLSLVTLATLGYGDIVPTSGWLRVLGPLEALVGFGLLTASLTWLLSLYPAFARRQSLAREATLLRESEQESALEEMGGEAAERVLGNLTSQLVTVRGDLVRFPITYYFHNSDERYSLPQAMPYLARLAERAGGAGRTPGMRLRASMLRCAVEDYLETVASNFLGLPAAPTGEILEAHAHDHPPSKS